MKLVVLKINGGFNVSFVKFHIQFISQLSVHKGLKCLRINYFCVRNHFLKLVKNILFLCLTEYHALKTFCTLTKPPKNHIPHKENADTLMKLKIKKKKKVFDDNSQYRIQITAYCMQIQYFDLAHYILSAIPLQQANGNC
jgi:hypothetical protein